LSIAQNERLKAEEFAKAAEAQKRGVRVEQNIQAAWRELPVPAWELCRVLGNLIDNAMDALEGRKGARLKIALSEDVRSISFAISNNGPAIPEKQRAKIFEPGFTTKKTGQGMGLFIVSQTVTEMGGRITVESHDGDTVFSGFVPRKRLKLGDGAETEPKENAPDDEQQVKYEENAKKDDNSINKLDANS